MLCVKAGKTICTIRYKCFHTYRKQDWIKMCKEFQQWMSLGKGIINVKFSFFMKMSFNKHVILLNSE